MQPPCLPSVSAAHSLWPPSCIQSLEGGIRQNDLHCTIQKTFRGLAWTWLPSLCFNLQTGFHHRILTTKYLQQAHSGGALPTISKNNPWTFGWFRYILPLLKTTLRLGHPFFVSQALHQQCPVEQQHLNLHSLGLNKNTRIQESQKSVFLAPKFFVFLHKPRKNWIPWVHRSWVVEHLVLFGPFQPYFPDFFDPFQEPMLLSFAVCLLSILSYRSCPTPFSLVYQIKWFIYLFLGCVHKHTCSCPPKAKQERASSVSVNISLA